MGDSAWVPGLSALEKEAGCSCQEQSPLSGHLACIRESLTGDKCHGPEVLSAYSRVGTPSPEPQRR